MVFSSVLGSDVGEDQTGGGVLGTGGEVSYQAGPGHFGDRVAGAETLQGDVSTAEYLEIYNFLQFMLVFFFYGTVCTLRAL